LGRVRMATEYCSNSACVQWSPYTTLGRPHNLQSTYLAPPAIQGILIFMAASELISDAMAMVETSPNTPSGVIVVCGSMSHYQVMIRLRYDLNIMGIDAIIPEDERNLSNVPMSKVDYSQYKRRLSERYFRIIRKKNVFGILIANRPKHGRDNYIGPNTLAEIAIAVNARKRIFLLEDIYEELADELVAWQAVPLRGDLKILIQEFTQTTIETRRQLTFQFSHLSKEEKTLGESHAGDADTCRNN